MRFGGADGLQESDRAGSVGSCRPTVPGGRPALQRWRCGGLSGDGQGRDARIAAKNMRLSLHFFNIPSRDRLAGKRPWLA